MPRKPLILVVDDRASNIQAVGALLTRANYEVMPALSGEQALTRCEQRLPDLVLLDMQMPGMNGHEVCQRLKSTGRTAEIPVIFLTASHERELLVQAFSIGAVDYVTKPFVSEELLARVKTHLELKSARDRLAALAQERAELTQVVAHDLKNPLTSILLGADSLADSPGDLAKQQRVTAGIREAVNRCLSFIDGYLGRWALGEAPRPADLNRFELGQVVREAATGMQSAAEKHGLSLTVAVEPGVQVIGNANALRRVLENLLSNAMRYGASGGSVEVSCELGRSGMAKASVKDRGPGVPAEKHKQLFQRYSQLDANNKPEHSSGLGLAIAKEEVSRMGGHLWYEDRDGGGAQFSLVLPLSDD